MVEKWQSVDKKTHIIFYLIILLLFSSNVSAQSPIQGIVVGLAYGDTITIFQNNKQYKIRLYGIDTPEKKQDFGQKAKQFTSNMVFNKIAKVIPMGTDRYQRTVGIVYVNGKCLNEELLKTGYAWVYQKYCKKSFCEEWLKLEQNARKNKLGLWVYDNPIAPWDFRHGKSQKKINCSGSYHGNVKSHVLHAPWFKYFDCKNCTKIFNNKNTAIDAGYKPCGICKP